MTRIRDSGMEVFTETIPFLPVSLEELKLSENSITKKE